MLFKILFFIILICSKEVLSSDDIKLEPKNNGNSDVIIHDEGKPIIKNITSTLADSSSDKKEQELKDTHQNNVKNIKNKKSFVDDDTLTYGFFLFILMGFFAIVFIAYRTYKLRFSRAERKYGVQGQKGTQELTPLPLAIEDDDSECDDQTLFDIKQSRFIKENFVA